jgi:hypothetical protein
MLSFILDFFLLFEAAHLLKRFRIFPLTYADYTILPAGKLRLHHQLPHHQPLQPQQKFPSSTAPGSATVVNGVYVSII